jgi:hypothetical protein
MEGILNVILIDAIASQLRRVKTYIQRQDEGFENGLSKFVQRSEFYSRQGSDSGHLNDILKLLDRKASIILQPCDRK